MMWGYDFGWGGIVMMTFGMVFWVAVLIVLAWALIRWVNTKTFASTPPTIGAGQAFPSALSILQQRYARGEIDATTFDQMRERLEATGAAKSPLYHNSHQEVTRSH